MVGVPAPQGESLGVGRGRSPRKERGTFSRTVVDRGGMGRGWYGLTRAQRKGVTTQVREIRADLGVEVLGETDRGRTD